MVTVVVAVTVVSVLVWVVVIVAGSTRISAKLTADASPPELLLPQTCMVP